MPTTTVTVLGSGDAFNSAGRGNAGYLVEDARGAFCVDFGPTALQALKARRFDLERLDAVLLTHLHGDHFGGLHLLFIDAQFGTFRRRPLLVAGPRGTEETVERWYRLAYGEAGDRRTYPTRYLELAPGEARSVAGRRVRTFAARHMDPADGALLLRIDAGGAQLAFTGDTGWTDDLPALADGADLLVCECTDDRAGIDSHLSWERLAPRFGELGARRILLTHLSAAMRARAGARRAPRVRFADDGTVVRLRKKG